MFQYPHNHMIKIWTFGNPLIFMTIVYHSVHTKSHSDHSVHIKSPHLPISPPSLPFGPLCTLPLPPALQPLHCPQLTFTVFFLLLLTRCTWARQLLALHEVFTTAAYFPYLFPFCQPTHPHRNSFLPLPTDLCCKKIFLSGDYQSKVHNPEDD